MDALLRRRQMMSSGASPDTPVFYDRLVFDGTAYIDTNITPAADCSFRVALGDETIKATQRLFMVATSSGKTGAILGTSTNETDRVPTVYYGKSSAVGGNNNLAFASARYGFFLTPKRYGWGSLSYTITKGNEAPSGTLVIGSNVAHSGQSYSGTMGQFRIYGSDAQNVSTNDGFNSYTPVYTLRPCLYNGEAGLWCEETLTFFGNSAGAGTLTVQNNS